MTSLAGNLHSDLLITCRVRRTRTTCSTHPSLYPLSPLSPLFSVLVGSAQAKSGERSGLDGGCKFLERQPSADNGVQRLDNTCEVGGLVLLLWRRDKAVESKQGLASSHMCVASSSPSCMRALARPLGGDKYLRAHVGVWVVLRCVPGCVRAHQQLVGRDDAQRLLCLRALR